jgi:hypothetical protein
MASQTKAEARTAFLRKVADLGPLPVSMLATRTPARKAGELAYRATAFGGARQLNVGYQPGPVVSSPPPNYVTLVGAAASAPSLMVFFKPTECPVNLRLHNYNDPRLPARWYVTASGATTYLMGERQLSLRQVESSSQADTLPA